VRRFDSTAVLGNQVTIGGAGFTGVLSVTLNNQRLKILSSTPTRIVATVNSVFAVGQYRLVIEAGNTSVTSTANIPSPSMVFLQCFEGYSGGGTGQTYTIYLLGDQPCNSGSNYPPYAGVPFPAGAVSNLRVKGAFTGAATVFVNYAPTALSCAIADNPPNLESSCTDLTDLLVINAGDELNFGITPTAPNGVNQVRCHVRVSRAMSIACPTPPVDPSISKIKETARRIHSQQSLRSARTDADRIQGIGRCWQSWRAFRGMGKSNLSQCPTPILAKKFRD